MSKVKFRLALVVAVWAVACLAFFMSPQSPLEIPELLAQASPPELRPANTINWTLQADAASYEVRVVAVGAGPTGTAVVSIADHTTTGVGTPTSLGATALFASPNIVSGTDYDFFLRGRDGSGNMGPWSAPLTLTFINTNLVAPGGFTITKLLAPGDFTLSKIAA